MVKHTIKNGAECSIEEGLLVEASGLAIPDYGPRDNAFSGTVNWVEIDVDKEALDQDHFLTGEERLHIAIARQ